MALRNKYRQELDKEIIRMEVNPRQVDFEAIEDLLNNAIKQDNINSILADDRYKRRQLKTDAEIERPKWNPQYGEQTICDIRPDQSWQKDYYDQTGKVVPVGKPWVCPHCGAKYLMAWPPDRCTICGTLSPIKTGELNLRK